MNIFRRIITVACALAVSVMAVAQDCPSFIEQTFQSGTNFYTWRLSYVSYEFDGTDTTICYELQDVTVGGTGDRILSHYVVGFVCDELADNFISATYNGSPTFETIGVDPTTGIFGIKFDNASPGTYCFTFEGEFFLGCTKAALKNGNTTTPLQQDIVGLVCDNGGGGEDPPESLIAGFKWYDADLDGVYDPEEVGLEGWAVQVCIDVDGPNTGDDPFYFVAVTDADGYWSAAGEEDWYYSVSELFPVENNWIQTYPVPNLYTGQFTANTINGLDFGNVCVGEGGGRTMGFWGNKNGQALIDADDMAALVALNLKNEDGSDFDPVNKSEYRKWLRNSRAVNMQYMLSAQLSAMVLNVREGFVDGTALVYAGDCGNTGINGDFISINDLIDAANAALNDGSATRDELECLKNALDDANNNMNFVMSEPCPYSFVS